MASALFLSEDQFLCSICLDVFTEPVTIPCGHNFCKPCITKHWGDKNHCYCPLCNEKFNKGLKLCVNVSFREVVENFKKHRVISENGIEVKPGEVPCDFCLGKKFKAYKTCLECLASFCKRHLEPHQVVSAFSRHQLTDPAHNQKDKICKKHNRISDLFCKKDLTRVCVLCTEHKAHDTVPLEKEYNETKAQLEQKKLEVKAMIKERQKKAQEIKDLVDTKRKEKDEALANSAHAFSTLVAPIQRSLTELMSAIEQKQNAAERQGDVLVKELESEINVLHKSVTKLQQISCSEDQVQLITSFLSFPSTPLCTKNWSNVVISGQPYVDDLKKAIVTMEVTLAKELEEAGKEFRVCCSKILAEESDIVRKTECQVVDLETLPRGAKLDTIRQQYTVDMTFDPCTANDLLIFSKDLKEVQTSHIYWCGNEVPQKFNRYAYVLGKKGFSEGRFYYEVQAARKTGWDLGVVRGSMRWKKTHTLNPGNGVWILRLRNNTKYTALNHAAVKIPVARKAERVGVFVDYKKRSVSFYDVSTATLIHSFTGCAFNETIYPFFSPGPPEDGLNCAPLVLSPTKHSTEKLNEFFSLIAVVIALVLFWIF
ncbi:E3 ubiquitin-protein ligase TRIM39-like [Echeneis naucrates]|uniref:E3 ubiquitin-protein ligase TRIM39-like n=1 Tax=Echeneis naucrates TaxID=173247 RepID=UPI00111401E3|nr:E3 ubiquitin-protein ligase TRIM39-like [Echeneis naucrates]